MLIALRNHLKTHPDLQALWLSLYNKDARHFIGYKRTPSANDYPSICYVSVRQKLADGFEDEHLISLVVAVHEPDVTDDIFNGVSVLDEVQAIIVQFLKNYSTDDCTWVDGPITATSDMGLRHPFYEREIQFTLKTLG